MLSCSSTSASINGLGLGLCIFNGTILSTIKDLYIYKKGTIKFNIDDLYKYILYIKDLYKYLLYIENLYIYISRFIVPEVKSKTFPETQFLQQ